MQYCCFTAPNFTFTTRHIYNWASFLFQPSHFILSGTISNCPLLFPSSTLDTFRQEGSSSVVIASCLLILFMGFLPQECWSVLPFPPPVDHVLSALFTVTHLSWVALHGMAYSFIGYSYSYHTENTAPEIRMISAIWVVPRKVLWESRRDCSWERRGELQVEFQTEKVEFSLDQELAGCWQIHILKMI